MPIQESISRREFLEEIAIAGGVGVMAVSGADYLISSATVANRVNEEKPFLLTTKIRNSLNEIKNRIAANGSRNMAQQKTLEQAEGVLNYDELNEAERLERANQLQVESDQTLVLGLVERGRLRVLALQAGLTAVGVATVSRIARAFGK